MTEGDMSEKNKETSTLQNLIESDDFRLEGIMQLLEDKGIVTKEELTNHFDRVAKMKQEEERKKEEAVKAGMSAKEIAQAEEWQELMNNLDSHMPRTLEDIYDGLVSFGIPIESFAPYVQEAYTSKKQARAKKPL